MSRPQTVGGDVPPGLVTANVSTRHSDASVTVLPSAPRLPNVDLPIEFVEVDGPEITNC